MKYTRRSNNFLCISIALCVGGLCLIVSRPIIGDCLLSLECNPLLFNMWKNVAYDVYAELYLFNWTNPEDLHNMSVKPRFEEIGPFVFQLDEEKWNIVWNNNGTVTFQQRRFWYFKDNEIRSLDKKVTNVDVIFLVLFTTYFSNILTKCFRAYPTQRETGTTTFVRECF